MLTTQRTRSTRHAANWRAWFAFVADLRQDGYHSDDRNSDDRAAAHDSACPGCGHEYRDFQGFRNPGTGSYRAFALCPACGQSEEF